MLLLQATIDNHKKEIHEITLQTKVIEKQFFNSEI
jgi:hypothetical protein